MRNTIRHRLACTLATIVGLLVLTGCERESEQPSATDRALDELQEKYDDLVNQEIENPVQWAADDLENIGDWEYKILDLADEGPEALQATLDELGNERWEVFWIENGSNNYRVMLKRPSRSYLSRIPLSQIGRFVIGRGGDEQ